LPGAHDGQIDADVSFAWVEVVRSTAKADDRSQIADEFIGHLLAYAVADPDGAWPHRVVRELVEKMSSTHLETGIEVERFNMRGPHTRALYGGGAPERGMAEEVREWSKKTRTWPRTSAMLERLAQSWDRMGKLQDEPRNRSGCVTKRRAAVLCGFAK
jgi:(2Fe-2S) ferredoxin